MIKAIVFDMGGVYVNDVYPLVMGHVAETFHTSVSALEVVNKKRFEQLQRGEITTMQCFAPLQDVFGVRIPEDELTDLLKRPYKDVYEVNEQIRHLMLSLKSTYKIVLLSNTEKDIAKINRDNHLFDVFDAVILSCEIGMRKPSREIFEYLMKKMDMPASALFFVDDLIENIAGADRVRILGHQYRSYERLLKALVAHGIEIPK